jgi:hypothetical protein
VGEDHHIPDRHHRKPAGFWFVRCKHWWSSPWRMGAPPYPPKLLLRAYWIARA